MHAEFRLLHSLEKLFANQTPAAQSVQPEGFLNEAVSFQVAMTLRGAETSQLADVEIVSEAKAFLQLYQVRHVPVAMPCYPDTDENYLRKTAGLYPDLLRRVKPHNLRIRPERWDCLWVVLDARGSLAPGEYPVTLRFKTEGGEALGEVTQTVRLLDGTLPKQKLIHTKWFHADCLAQYYHVPVFSEAHWTLCERFILSAVEGGVNMILMPVHTPPLDTRAGGERPTAQLVGIEEENGRYRFDMTRVRRWIGMCKRLGVEYYEIAHLFTQWGAAHAPKIIARQDGQERRIFGWETDAAGEAYGAFLRQYIPALRRVFEEEGIEDRVWWHISDEPSGEQLPGYLAAKRQVEEALLGANVMDALSDFAFYRDGVVQHPVVASDHIGPFLDAGVKDLWMYYCCAQHRDVSNLFVAMPGVRCRVLGMQLFRFRLAGFLQWGYNFYHSVFSDYPVNPYETVDADGWVPAGDPFQVYPGADGFPEPSMRWMHAREAMQDLRALERLESLVGFDRANDLLGDMTLTHYMRDAGELYALRHEINRLIMEETACRKS